MKRYLPSELVYPVMIIIGDSEFIINENEEMLFIFYSEILNTVKPNSLKMVDSTLKAYTLSNIVDFHKNGLINFISRLFLPLLPKFKEESKTTIYQLKEMLFRLICKNNKNAQASKLFVKLNEKVENIESFNEFLEVIQSKEFNKYLNDMNKNEKSQLTEIKEMLHLCQIKLTLSIFLTPPIGILSGLFGFYLYNTYETRLAAIPLTLSIFLPFLIYYYYLELKSLKGLLIAESP